MKRFSVVLAVLVASIWSLAAQDVALLDERVKQLLGKVETLEEANAGLKRQVDSLVKELSSLREQMQSQPSTPTASSEDLRDLARKVQEIERKREADRELILKEINELGRIIAKGGGTRSPRSVANDPKPGPSLPKEGLEHTIASGDTLSTIAAAYSKETGKKITVDLILRANEGLKAERLVVGKKIQIPLPEK